MLHDLRHREDGSRSDVVSRKRLLRGHSLQLAPKSFKGLAKCGGVNWLSLDTLDQRYLLVSSHLAIAAYDTAAPSSTGNAAGSSHPPAEDHSPIFKLDKGHASFHKYVTNCAVWYPVDTGLFVSASHDNSVKVWDTNCIQVAHAFHTPAHVCNVAMSGTSSPSILVAAAGHDGFVRLCDITSGAFTHTLTGHQGPVWAVAWSLTSPYVLLSGGVDGQIRVWDVRKAGCMEVCDQHASYTPATLRKRLKRRVALDDGATAHDGAVTGLAPTLEGLAWVSGGTDSRVRMWDSVHFRNMLINYQGTHNRASKPRQLALDGEGDLLFHPSGSITQVLSLRTGQQIATLQGHMESVNACAYSVGPQELYTGANDSQVLAWAPREHIEDEGDTWSD